MNRTTLLFALAAGLTVLSLLAGPSAAASALPQQPVAVRAPVFLEDAFVPTWPRWADRMAGARRAGCALDGVD
jgi:hypothetical protein